MIRTAPEICAGAITTSSDALKIAVYLADQNPHRDRSLGITTMTQALLDQFAMRNDVDVTQITSTSSFAVPNSVLRSKNIPLNTDRFFGRLLVDGFHPWFVQPDVDVWYYPKGYAPRFSHPNTPSVGTMHDVIVQHYADHYPDSRSRTAFRYWVNAIRHSLKRFQSVLTVSEHAAKQLRVFCDRYAIRPPQISVTYEGTPWESYRTMTFQKRDQMIHLASALPHKGTHGLIQMWQTIQQQNRDLPELLLVGDLSQETRALALQTAGVRLSPRLTTDQLRDEVGRSIALLMPSEIEGFGLPVLEAYYVGTPACFIRGTSVDEVLHADCDSGQTMPGGFHPNDVDSFSIALDEIGSLSTVEIRATSDRLYGSFASDLIAERVVSALRVAAQ